MASFLWEEAKKPNKQKKTRVFLVEGRPALDGGGRSGPTLEETKKEGCSGARRQEQHNCHWPARVLARVAKPDKIPLKVYLCSFLKTKFLSDLGIPGIRLRNSV